MQSWPFATLASEQHRTNLVDAQHVIGMSTGCVKARHDGNTTTRDCNDTTTSPSAPARSLTAHPLARRRHARIILHLSRLVFIDDTLYRFSRLVKFRQVRAKHIFFPVCIKIRVTFAHSIVHI